MSCYRTRYYLHSFSRLAEGWRWKGFLHKPWLSRRGECLNSIIFAAKKNRNLHPAHFPLILFDAAAAPSLVGPAPTRAPAGASHISPGHLTTGTASTSEGPNRWHIDRPDRPVRGVPLLSAALTGSLGVTYLYLISDCPLRDTLC
jgi:hypothetical protein